MKRVINCPKCHKDLAVLRTDYFPNRNIDQKVFSVYCHNCGERTLFYSEEERAIEAWNNMSLKSFLDDIEDHMVENSFESMVIIKNFDDDNIYGCQIPDNDYMTTKQLFLMLVNEMCSRENKFTKTKMFTKEELCNWIKES